MKLLFSILLISSGLSSSAQIIYSPSQTNEVWIDYSYYDAEFIFIDNQSSKSITLNFENTELDIPSEWHAAACTSQGCFTDIPSSGSLGTIPAGDQAYFSINLTANQTEGDGTISYAISDASSPNLADTIKFIYHANEIGSIIVGPWAKVNYFDGTMSVFLRDDNIPASVKVFDVRGNIVVNETVNGLYSYRLGDLEGGMYILVIEDELGRVHKERLLNL